MELLQLRYFRTAAQLENFSKTAEQYMIPQSAVSKTIRKLEEELGCELFTRNGKKISLNENGKLFLEKINIALTNIDSAVDAVKYQELNIIGIQVQSGVRFIPDLISAFEKSHPNSKIVYYQGTAIRHHEADFTFFQLPIDERVYAYRSLMEDEVMLAASRQSKWAKKKEINLAALHDESFISYNTENPLRVFTENICKEQGFLPNIIFEANTVASLRSMIEANLGISLVPSTSWMTNASKHAILIPFTTHPKRHLVLAWKKNQVLSPSMQSFIDFAADWFQQFGNKS